LLTEEVWVVFDHTARLANAFNERPDDFVAFPAPAGPTGRGFMPVVVGIGIPKTAPDMDAAKKLLALPPAVQTSGAAIAAMSGSADANPGLLPVGLGKLGGEFNQVYVDSFERIVLGGEDVRAVLDEQAEAAWNKFKELWQYTKVIVVFLN